MRDRSDIVVVGAGAAGLMAAISARRANPSRRVVVLDGAKKLGAKILIAGGGRCNVTHHRVDETAFAGSTRPAIRKVLGRFDVARTVAFFEEIGVTLKREETGKLFPTTDDAHTVLDALLREARRVGVEILHPCRVTAIERASDGFVVTAGAHRLEAERVVIATGGKSIPKSGSDGLGYELVKALGHSITPLVTPGLVPLTLPRDHFLCALAGVTLDVTIELRSGTGKRLESFTNSTLLTHFGLSGPSVLDISRYYLQAIASDSKAGLFANWLPGRDEDALDRELQSLRGKSVGGYLRERLPERLARALCEHAGVDPATRGDALKRDGRRAVAAAACNLPLPVTGNRGYTYAEVTAGGVPLAQLHLDTMESRVCPGLYLCGEICDVDGRIGGFNFQWAWSSGFVAGTAASK
ncbi:MAG TPA: NAD(P)/FAD-dependent oxidoreductase [Candidatus Krumholzibacteria bacterium]|nr:NAD(P)/FAD-dependent oxidoreductase [Candidatus Krumholzibacteria bacterium]